MLFLEQKLLSIERSFLELLLECFGLLLTCIELVDGTRLEKSLLPCIERMTFRTCFHTDVITFDRTSRFESMSTRTDDFDLLPGWMNIFFHKRKWLRVIVIAQFSLTSVSRRKGTKTSFSFFMANEKTMRALRTQGYK